MGKVGKKVTFSPQCDIVLEEVESEREAVKTLAQSWIRMENVIVDLWIMDNFGGLVRFYERWYLPRMQVAPSDITYFYESSKADLAIAQADKLRKIAEKQKEAAQHRRNMDIRNRHLGI
jgi:hypothetical protein